MRKICNEGCQKTLREPYSCSDCCATDNNTVHLLSIQLTQPYFTTLFRSNSLVYVVTRFRLIAWFPYYWCFHNRVCWSWRKMGATTYVNVRSFSHYTTFIPLNTKFHYKSFYAIPSDITLKADVFVANTYYGRLLENKLQFFFFFSFNLIYYFLRIM